MSYSFDFTAPSKAEAKHRVTRELKNIADQQPSHHKDHHATVVAAHAFIDMLADDPAMDVQVHVHGSVGWHWESDDPHALGPNARFTNASVAVSAWHTIRITKDPE